MTNKNLYAHNGRLMFDLNASYQLNHSDVAKTSLYAFRALAWASIFLSAGYAFLTRQAQSQTQSTFRLQSSLSR